MMDAMGGYPEDRAALKGEASAGADEVLDPLGSPVAAVGEQAMVGHADADVDREEVHDNRDGEIGPREEEERGDSAYVKEAHGDGCDPVDATLLMLAAHAKILFDLLLNFGDYGEDGRAGGCGLCGLDFFGGDRGRAHIDSLSLNC
jgi:hypothetical protein